MKQNTLKCILTFLQWSSFQYWLYFWPCSCVCIWCVHMQHIISSVCTHFFLFCIVGHHIPWQRKSAVYYLVYLDIWLLLFRSMPTQILLIALTNIGSPVCHKSTQDTVVAPSEFPNLNVSAGVKPGSENPYHFCVYNLLYCKLSHIVLSSISHSSSVDQSTNIAIW